METKIISMNVRGLGNKTKRHQVFEWFKDNNFDIILIQEVHCNDKILATWKDEWNGPCFFNGDSTQKEGVAVLFNPKNTNIHVKHHYAISEGKLSCVDICLNETELSIINVYGPNKDDPTLFNNLEQFILSNDRKIT